MAESQLIASYKYWLDRVRVYSDRVEIGALRMQSYPIAAIARVDVSPIPLLGNGVRLILRDGSVSTEVVLRRANAEACLDVLTPLLPSEPPPFIAAYASQRHRVLIYPDRVEIGTRRLRSYSLGAIVSLEVSSFLYGLCRVHLLLRDGSRSAEAMLRRADAEACLNTLTPLLPSEPVPFIAVYTFQRYRVVIYHDRVEIGTRRLQSYPLATIARVEVPLSLFALRRLRLILRDGSRSTEVTLRRADAEACLNTLTPLLQSLPDATAVTAPSINEVVPFRSDTARSIGEAVPSIKCTILGGTGTSLVSGKDCTAVFGFTAIVLFSDSQRLDIPLNTLMQFDVGGPGRVTSDAGLIGGGFGFGGAAKGIALATIINALTTTSTTNTIMHVVWPGAELFLHTSSHTPEEARILLSHVFVACSQRNAPPMPTTDTVSQLERLRVLRDSGALTPEEYIAAKAKVLG